MANLPKKIFARQHEITAGFLAEIDRHLRDITEGRVTEMHEIRDIAGLMHIHPTHLSNTIKLTTGKAPCYFFEEKLMDISKTMLAENTMSIAQIAALLTYDPSNFTKFFKRFSGMTPKQYRETALAEKSGKAETLTI